ncbi:MAG: DUF6531 domain-containing protein, partial [Verrucomicrobia bacterium]|nr:DUF6531 domain-containing protein [Verrucomicrobiota bacterium]
MAPGSILDGNTADLIFESVSPPVITEDGRRAAFAANLSSDLTMPQSVKSYWFADLKEDDFYDLTLAAISGMEVEGSDMVLDLDWINTGNGFESPRNIAQIALDTVTGKLAFVAGLVAKENPGEPETALFIADTTGIELVTKQGPSGIKTQPQFEGDVPIDIDVGFQEIKFVNDRLVFNSSVTNPTTFIQSTGIAVYENRELTYPIISAVGIPSSFFDSQVNQEVTIERTGQVATNANGAIVYTLSGRVPNAPACTFNNRNVELLRYRSPGEEAFTTISKNWNTLPEGSGFFEDTFISGFREISLNADNDVVAIASLGEFVGEQTQDCPLGTPDFPTNKSAIILFETVDQTPTESVIVATADMAEGYEGVGSNIINRLDSLQMAGSYVSYYAYFPGDPINFGSTIALYRTHLDFEGPGELIFHLAGPSHVEGLGTIDLIIHSLLGPNGDMVVQLITNDRSRRGLVYVSPPDEEGNSEYTLLASSSSNQNFLCEEDCNSFPPELAALGFIPGGNVLGPSLGPEAGYGTWINTYQAGWMLTNDMFSSNRREYSVLFKFGEPPVIEEPTFPQPPGLTLDGSSDTAYQISLKNIEEKDYEIWESNDLNLWSFLAKLSETPGSPLPAQVSVPKPLVDSTFWDLRNVSPPPVEALPAITTSSGIQNAFLHTGNAGEPILSSAVASYGAAAAGAGLNVFSQSPSLIAPALVGIQVGLNAGEMNVEKTDLTIQGVGNIHFKMTRSYRSQLAYDGPLGYGWDFRYNERLFIQENGDAHHLNGQGGLLIWISTSPSTFKSPTGHFGTLRKNTDGSFSSRDPDGFKHHFTDQGRLSSLEDCWGNTLTLTYDQRGNIQHIFDPYGRRIDFGYAPVAGVDRLQQVRDYTGRTLVYNYNQKGNLTEVTGPKIVGSLNGNDFPFGRTELYTYKSDIANAQLDHNLLTITLPEQVAQADPPNVVVQYGEDSNNPDSLDKVVS